MAARGYVIDGTVVLPATSAVGTAGVSGIEEGDNRLRELDDLKAQGLVTQEEYRQKRVAIVGYEEVTTGDRLLELRDLLNKKLISRTEYDQKRREILDAL
jgi:hypothetical protein